jgi:predicted DCC family thiol-disulfide oxidoreductase YuxK
MQQFIILFDGVCNLCNGFVQFVIKRDTQAQFKFAALQSDTAKALLIAHKIQIKDLKTVVFIENQKVYTQSDAALQIAKYLGSAWPLARILFVVPKFIRNGIYRFIAKNRYRWFGKTEQCMVPNANLKSRFL